MDRRSLALESSGDQPEASVPKTTPKKVPTLQLLSTPQAVR